MAMEQIPQQPSAPQEEGGDSVQKLIANISNGLSVLGDVAQSAGMGDQILQIGEAFKQAVEQLMSGGGQSPQAPGQGAPEAGAAQARPASMAMR